MGFTPTSPPLEIPDGQMFGQSWVYLSALPGIITVKAIEANLDIKAVQLVSGGTVNSLLYCLSWGLSLMICHYGKTTLAGRGDVR